MDVRKRILEEAVRLFGEQGYEGASVQAIADAVGIRKQSLFHHFNTKADLRHAVVADLLGHWQDELPRLLAEASSGYDRFSSTIEALVDFLLEDTNRARMAIREMLDRPENSRDLISEQLKPWTTLMVNYIRMGQDIKMIQKDVDPDSYIILVMMMAIGMVALGPVASAITEIGSESAMETKVKELVRIASQSFFEKRSKPKTAMRKKNG